MFHNHVAFTFEELQALKALFSTIFESKTSVNKSSSLVSLGIGDGGNELGMGNLKEKVKALMPNGSLIACDVSADYAVTAGVKSFIIKKMFE